MAFTSIHAIKKNATEPSVTRHLLLEWHGKGTFYFSEILNSHGLKRTTVCQIVRFIFHFLSVLKMFFQSTISCIVSSGYWKKSRILDFWQNPLARLSSTEGCSLPAPTASTRFLESFFLPNKLEKSNVVNCNNKKHRKKIIYLLWNSQWCPHQRNNGYKCLFMVYGEAAVRRCSAN